MERKSLNQFSDENIYKVRWLRGFTYSPHIYYFTQLQIYLAQFQMHFTQLDVHFTQREVHFAQLQMNIILYKMVSNF